MEKLEEANKEEGNEKIIMKKTISGVLVLVLLCSFAGCSNRTNNQTAQKAETLSYIYEQYPNANSLILNGNSAELNGTVLKEYDYIWTFNPSMSEPEFSGRTT